MNTQKLKYVYGPVYSWRMGMSLGIDPLTDDKKICNYDCVYCQLGRTTAFYTQREDFVPVGDIIDEIRSLPEMRIDYYTFSGRGEPTLAKNLGAMIRAVRAETGGKIAVITNAALINEPEVQDDLMLCDLVMVKLDAGDEASFKDVDIPAEGITFQQTVDGIKAFKKKFKGKLALQLMFIENNAHCAPNMASIARAVDADEVQINTPLRPSGVTPVNEDELLKVKDHFKGLPAITVYESERRNVKPLNERETILRHGNFKKNVKPKKS